MRLLIEIDATGPREQLHQMGSRLDNPRTMLGMLARNLEDYEREVFATSGHGSWAPDDPETVDLKGNGRVLVDEGNLLRQLTSARIFGESVLVDQGSAFYAGFLRDGDRGMPRRNPAPKPEKRHVDRWAEQLIGYIVTGRSL